METTFQPSLPSFRSKMAAIEAIELTTIGFLLWGLMMLVPTETPTTIAVAIGFLIFTQGLILGSWAIYLAYIRLTRGLYPRLDLRLRIVLAIFTSSYTLWTWLALDINRWIMSKLFYQGEAPVEYAWSSKSKLARKEWEQAQKARNVYTSM
jgi:hypothetical protein